MVDHSSWITWNSFPSGSRNRSVVPHSSFFTDCEILTACLRSLASSWSASSVEKRNPVFPFSGRASGQRWSRTFAPRGATVTQWGNDVTTRKPTFSFQNFVAFFSSRTTTATVSNLSMDAPNRPWAIRYALPTTEALYEFSTWVRWGKSMTEVERVVGLGNDETDPCFGGGPRNPRGLQLVFRRVGNRVETELLADVTMEGWPGRLHSGILYT